MDATFFKERQKRLGVTNDDLARAIGRDRAVISNIYSGKRPMKPAEADVFSRLLNVPVEQVLAAAGVFTQAAVAMARPSGMAEDARPFDWTGAPERDAMAALFNLDRSGVDVWRVSTDAMTVAGYRQGDAIVVDTRRPDAYRKGDDVIVQVYDLSSGSAVTLLRRVEPPIIFALPSNLAQIQPMVIDNERIVVRGIVVGSWRLKMEAA